jgi:hypothetical protein
VTTTQIKVSDQTVGVKVSLQYLKPYPLESMGIGACDADLMAFLN